MLAFAEMPPTPTKPAPATGPRAGWWPLLAGLFLAFVLLKLGNPVILDHIAGVPEGWEEIIFETWPAAWGYCVLAVVTVVGALQWRRGLACQSGRWCSRGLARVAVRRGGDDGGCLVDQGGAAAVCRDGGLFRGGPERGAFRRGATGLAGFARGIAVGAGLRIPAAIRGLGGEPGVFLRERKDRLERRSTGGIGPAGSKPTPRAPARRNPHHQPQPAAQAGQGPHHGDARPAQCPRRSRAAVAAGCIAHGLERERGCKT